MGEEARKQTDEKAEQKPVITNLRMGYLKG
jgi:hypothetical protein